MERRSKQLENETAPKKKFKPGSDFFKQILPYTHIDPYSKNFEKVWKQGEERECAHTRWGEVQLKLELEVNQNR